MAEDSSVERLKKKLYARGEGPHLRERRVLEEKEYDPLAHNWINQEDVQQADDALAYDPEAEFEAQRSGHVPGMEDAPKQVPGALTDSRVQAAAVVERAKRRVVARVVRSIFIASLLFFLIAAGAAVYFFLIGNNQVTCDKIHIDVSGPMSVASGKELTLSVGIANDNPVPLEQTSLQVEYPEGTHNPDNPSVLLPVTHEDIGTIEAGERVRTTSRSLLFGREQETKQIAFTLKYKIRDSNAEFTCAVNNPVLIATAPITLSVDGLEEVSSDQEVTLTARINSNSEEVVTDQRLVVNYPFGFQFLRAEPDPSHDTNTWDIGDVGQGASRTIVIHGVVRSPVTEARSVSFTLGVRDPDNPGEVGTVLQKLEHPLLIARPFLELNTIVNNSTSDTLNLTAGGKVNGTVRWKNAMQDALYDVEVEAQLPAQYVDRKTVVPQDGYFRSVDNTMIWTSQTLPELREVSPNDTGQLLFTFKLLPLSTDTGARQPTFDLAFTVRARRSADNDAVQEVLVGQGKRTIKLETDLQFMPRIAYSYGPFVNTGPHPPRVDTETTYTVDWRITNTTNDLSDAQVRGTLPLNVKWLNVIAPEGEQVTYNASTREVSWHAGAIPAGTGVTLPQRTVAFQVALVPSIAQEGSKIPIIDHVVAQGVDAFTSDVVERDLGAQTTAIVGDPMFPNDRGFVLP